MGRVANDTLIPNGPVSLASTWTSEALCLDHIYLLSMQLVFTGTPNGIFHLEVSVQQPTDATEPTNWIPVKRSYQTVTAAGEHLWTFADMGFPHIRVVWTPTSGTGTLAVAQYGGKGV